MNPKPRSNPHNLIVLPLLAAAILLPAQQTSAQPITVAEWTQPDLDSYTYPFVGQRRLFAEAVFGEYNVEGFVGEFDNRGGQIQLGFDTTTKNIPTALNPQDYTIHNATLVGTIGRIVGSPAYDPTDDDVSTYPLVGRPATDPTPGRPITLFGMGFRNGYTHLEFGPTPIQGPPGFGRSGEGYASGMIFGQNIRHVYPIDFDESGNPRDVSSNLDEPNQGANAFNVTPFAIGTTTDRNPGDIIQIGDRFTFEIDITNPHILEYLQQGLAQGQLAFVLATLHPSVFDGVSTEGSYTGFYLSTNGQDAFTLRLEYSTGSPCDTADIDNSGQVNISDYFAFLTEFFSKLNNPNPGPTPADINNDGVVAIDDYFAYLNIFFACL